MSDMPEIIYAWEYHDNDYIEGTGYYENGWHRSDLNNNEFVQYIRKDKYDKLEKKLLAALKCINSIDDRMEYRAFTREDIHAEFEEFKNTIKDINNE